MGDEGIDLNATLTDLATSHQRCGLEEEQRSYFYKSYGGATIKRLTRGMRKGIELKPWDDVFPPGGDGRGLKAVMEPRFYISILISSLFTERLVLK